MAVTRQFSGFLAISAATLFLVGFFLFGSNFNRQFSYKSLLFSNTVLSDDADSSDPSSVTDVSQKPLNIAIAETTGFHDEVVAALVHSFGSRTNSNLSLFQKNQRYGIDKIMQNFKLPKPVPASQKPSMLLADSTTNFDILVLTTCEYDRITFSSQLETLLKEGKTHILCVVHHADHWANEDHENFIAPWVEKGLVDFITLSQHTATYLRETGMSAWKTKAPPIRPFAPVFPVNLPDLPKAVDADEEELGFGLQGLYESTRRNYKTIFSHLQNFIDSRSSERDGKMQSNVTLHLLGQGKHPEVPNTLTSHVSFDESLDYDEYYSILSRTFALLPAFASDDYLDRKASSTVPAGLIGGTPLVATKEIMAAYSYLSEDAVYLQKKGETEFDVIGRVLKDPGTHRIEKMQTVRDTCAELVESNSQLVEGWIKELTGKGKSEW